ncbi:MAG: hypothetical protein KF678_10355 [Phycisphaeraceae bacterium]|nr:hypothetical protein [Phycisphaeraceae bacterium]
MSKAKDLLGKTGSPGFQTEPKKSVVPFVHDSEIKDPKHPEFKPPQDDKLAKGSTHAAGGGAGAKTVRPKV